MYVDGGTQSIIARMNKDGDVIGHYAIDASGKTSGNSLRIHERSCTVADINRSAIGINDIANRSNDSEWLSWGFKLKPIIGIVISNNLIVITRSRGPIEI